MRQIFMLFLLIGIFSRISGLLTYRMQKRMMVEEKLEIGGEKVDQVSDKKNIFKKAMNNFLGVHYDVFLSVGPEKQEFKVVLDTGSSDFWIPSIECSNCFEMGLWNHYDCEASPTCLLSSDQTEIEYAKGKVEGQLANEIIWYDEEKTKSFNFTFILATQLADFQRSMIDGIIGVGPTSFSATGKTFIDSLVENEIIKSRVFSLKLDPLGQCQNYSSITFGGYDPEINPEDIKYVPSEVQQYWAVSMQSAKIQTKRTDSLGEVRTSEDFIDTPVLTVIDSGTTNIVFSMKFMQRLIEKLDQKGVECSLMDSLLVCDQGVAKIGLNFEFRLGEHSFSIGEKALIGRCGIAQQRLKISCMMNIQFFDIGEDIQILGSVFMKDYQVIFDQDQQRIGFYYQPTESSVEDSLSSWRDRIGIIEYFIQFIVGTSWILLIYNCVRSKTTAQDEEFIRMLPQQLNAVSIELSEGQESYDEESSENQKSSDLGSITSSTQN